MNRKIRIALALRRGDWSILIQAWVWLLYLDLLLRCRPFPRVREVVANQHKVRPAPPPGQAWEMIRRYQRLVIIAAHNHLYRMECLRQALALKKILGRQGVPTELRFGVRKEAKQLLAHAWLEYEGQSIELIHTNEHFESLKKLEKRP